MRVGDKGEKVGEEGLLIDKLWNRVIFGLGWIEIRQAVGASYIRLSEALS